MCRRLLRKLLFGFVRLDSLIWNFNIFKKNWQLFCCDCFELSLNNLIINYCSLDVRTHAFLLQSLNSECTKDAKLRFYYSYLDLNYIRTKLGLWFNFVFRWKFLSRLISVTINNWVLQFAFWNIEHGNAFVLILCTRSRLIGSNNPVNVSDEGWMLQK